MMRASRFEDESYITHPRATALTYQPLPADTLHSLHIIRSLMAYTRDPQELAWLEARETFLIATCADCPPPRPVRNVEPARRDRPPRHETRYGLRGYGPTNKSGRAKS